jgi:hypothetical protein
MPVSVMLRTLTSRELTEWRAYELKNGPLDDAWRDESQSTLIDLMRVLTYLTSQAHFGSDGKKAVQGPVEAPKDAYTRPWDLHYPTTPEPDPETIEQQEAYTVEMINRTLNQREKNE